MRVLSDRSTASLASLVHLLFLLFALVSGTDELEKLERSCANYDVPGSPLAHDASTLESFAGAGAGRTMLRFGRRDMFARRAPPDCKLDLGTSFVCRPGCWWNEDTRKCNCCPQESHRCGAGKYCCPVGTYCMKSATGEEGCCPNGHQCAPPGPEDGTEHHHGNELRMEAKVSSPAKPRCANPSYELCPSQSFCCPPEWICYKDGMGTARCGRY